MSAETEVRDASKQFYDALNRMIGGDAGAMSAVWSHAANVTTMHPIGGREVGWDAVKGSWEGVAGLASGGKVELQDQLIRVVGDMAAEIGVEVGQFMLAGTQINANHRVTNLYQREGGKWKIIHHHTDLAPAMVELLKKLQAGAAAGRK
jgi:ketosteroid isomerase-like protein